MTIKRFLDFYMPEDATRDFFTSIDRKLIRRSMYKKALEDLVKVMSKRGNHPSHDIWYYAAKIANSYIGLDYRELGRYYLDTIKKK